MSAESLFLIQWAYMEVWSMGGLSGGLFFCLFSRRNRWSAAFEPRDLNAFSVKDFLVYPTHYTGEADYVSDTEESDTSQVADDRREICGSDGVVCGGEAAVSPREDLWRLFPLLTPTLVVSTPLLLLFFTHSQGLVLCCGDRHMFVWCHSNLDRIRFYLCMQGNNNLIGRRSQPQTTIGWYLVSIIINVKYIVMIVVFYYFWMEAWFSYALWARC